MSSLFLRTYAVLVGVVVAGLLVVWAWNTARSGPDPDVLDALLQAPSEIRGAFLALPEREAVRQVRDRLGAVDVHVFPEAELPRLPRPVRERLARGIPAGPGHRGGPPSLWVPVPERALVVHVLAQDRRAPVPVISAVVLVLLGVAVAMSLRPLQRDLGVLSGVADAFGRGEAGARVHLADSSPAAELGQRFNTMADRIGSLLEAQRELLLAVSHELRTPLNRIRFAADLLAEEADPEARASQAEALQGDVDELDELVAELLTWGRLAEAPEVARAPVELEPLVTALTEQVTRLRPEVVVTAEGISGTVLEVDAMGLRRAVSNLLRNAVRHAKGRVAVLGEAAGGTLRLHVDDDGPGIPEADRARVLEPFVRLDAARSRDAGGAGLGLALASRLAEAHGGSLSVGDAPLGGARLTLTLPLTVADSD